MARSWNDLSDDEKQSFRDKTRESRDKFSELQERYETVAENQKEGSFLKGLFSFLGKMAKSASKTMDNYSKKR